ncbi:MAG: restriction endonuclease subunit S [Saprospiraceae bacterium]
MKNYKIIRKNQFACSTMQVRRDKKMPVALLQEVDEAIISQAYPVFEVKDENQLLPEYLMMWFEHSAFDREACFHAVGGVRGSLEWEAFEDMQLPISHINKQREIVAEYNTIQNRIKLNEQLIQKLEETARAKNSSAKILPTNTVLIAMYGEGKTKGQAGYLRFEAATNQVWCEEINCKNKDKRLKCT